MLIKELILKRAKELFGVRPEDIVGPSRYSLYIPARFAVCTALSRRGWSYPQIGRFLGGRDHSSIIHAVRRAEYMESRDPEYASKIQELVNLSVHIRGPHNVRMQNVQQASSRHYS